MASSEQQLYGPTATERATTPEHRGTAPPKALATRTNVRAHSVTLAPDLPLDRGALGEEYLQRQTAATKWAVRVGGEFDVQGRFAAKVFDRVDQAKAYAQALALKGPEEIRRMFGLPREWPGHKPGSPVEYVFVRTINPGTNISRGVAAPQVETSSAPGLPKNYPGGGTQAALEPGALGTEVARYRIAGVIPSSALPRSPTKVPSAPSTDVNPQGRRSAPAAAVSPKLSVASRIANIGRRAAPTLVSVILGYLTAKVKQTYEDKLIQADLDQVWPSVGEKLQGQAAEIQRLAEAGEPYAVIRVRLHYMVMLVPSDPGPEYDRGFMGLKLLNVQVSDRPIDSLQFDARESLSLGTHSEYYVWTFSIPISSA